MLSRLFIHEKYHRYFSGFFWILDRFSEQWIPNTLYLQIFISISMSEYKEMHQKSSEMIHDMIFYTRKILLKQNHQSTTWTETISDVPKILRYSNVLFSFAEVPISHLIRLFHQGFHMETQRNVFLWNLYYNQGNIMVCPLWDFIWAITVGCRFGALRASHTSMTMKEKESI